MAKNNDNYKGMILTAAAAIAETYDFYSYEVFPATLQLAYDVTFTALPGGVLYQSKASITPILLINSADPKPIIKAILVKAADELKDKVTHADYITYHPDHDKSVKAPSDIAPYAPPKQTKIVEVKTIDDMYAGGARDSGPKKSKKSNKLGKTTLTTELIKAADELALKQAAEILYGNNPFLNYIKSNPNLTMSTPKTHKVIYGISEPSLADLYVKDSPEPLGEASTTNKPPKSDPE